MGFGNFATICLIVAVPMNVLSQEIIEWYGNNYVPSKFGETRLTEIRMEKNPRDQITLFREFFDKMNESDLYSNKAVMLGILVTELRMLYQQNPDLKYVISELPPQTLNIPWKRPVNIYNDDTQEYLCANDEPHTLESYHYKVYTSTINGENCFWNFNAEEYGRYFTIQNNANMRYLYAAPNPYFANKQQRAISTVNEISDKWQIEPQRNDHNDVFQYQIKSFLWKEFIMSTPGSSEVFARKFSNCDTNFCQWRLAIVVGRKPLPMDRELLLSDLYEQYKGESEIAEIILQHANNSRSRLAEYVNLFELMKKYDGFYTAAGTILDYNVEQLLEEYPNDLDLLEIEKHFRTLWNPFPWNRRIFLQNKADHKYFCPTDDIFSRYMTRMQDTAASCGWQFEIDSSGLFFRIKSFASAGYLTAVPLGILDFNLRRLTITNKNRGDQNKWQLIHGGVQKDAVRIKNVFWNETLYSFNMIRPATMNDRECQEMECDWQVHKSHIMLY